MFLNKDCKGGIRADWAASDRCAFSSCVGGSDAGHDSSWLLCLSPTIFCASFLKVTLTFLSFSPLLISFFCCLLPASTPLLFCLSKEIFLKKTSSQPWTRDPLNHIRPFPTSCSSQYLFIFSWFFADPIFPPFCFFLLLQSLFFKSWEKF